VPLLAARPGSGKRAGTRLTVAGRQILAAYEGLVTAAQAGAGGLTLELLEASLRKTPVARRPTANAA
jgi:molybdenum-dependent DNA-binding transcriptional regulator ModE